MVLLVIIMLSSLTDAMSDISSREVDLEDSSFSTEQEGAVEAKPKYNDYALNCLDRKGTSENCMKEPYKYYCDNQGRLRWTKKETAVCAYCDCINLNPKPACIINLIGQANCARGLDNDTEWESMDAFDRSHAIKEHQRLLDQDTDADLSIKLGGPSPQTSLASSHGLPMWFKKLSAVLGSVTGLAVPGHDAANPCVAGAAPMDLDCKLEARDSTKKKLKVQDCILGANPMDLTCELQPIA